MDSSSRPFCQNECRGSVLREMLKLSGVRQCPALWGTSASRMVASELENSNSRSQWLQKIPSCNSLSLSAQATHLPLSCRSLYRSILCISPCVRSGGRPFVPYAGPSTTGTLEMVAIILQVPRLGSFAGRCEHTAVHC